MVSRALAAEQADHDACARAWTALTAAHAQVSGQLAGALARQCGLAINEFEILLRLGQPADPVNGGLRLTDLLTTVPLTQSALSRAVARLAERGWITRAAAPDDGRGVIVAITVAGRSKLQAAIPVHASTIRAALLDRLTGTERDLLAQVLGRIAAG